jgi:hypothetical protein
MHNALQLIEIATKLMILSPVASELNETERGFQIADCDAGKRVRTEVQSNTRTSDLIVVETKERFFI